MSMKIHTRQQANRGSNRKCHCSCSCSCLVSSYICGLKMRVLSGLLDGELLYIYIYKDRQWFDPGWFAGMPYHILFGPDTGQHELCMIKQRSASTYKAYYDIAVSAEVMHSVRSHSGLWSEYSGQWKCFVISTSSALKRQVSFGFCLWIVQDTWVRGLERDCATRQGHHRWCLPSSATS